MEPSDAKSIAESVIIRTAKDIWGQDVLNSVESLGLSFRETHELETEVFELIENAKITVEFPED